VGVISSADQRCMLIGLDGKLIQAGTSQKKERPPREPFSLDILMINTDSRGDACDHVGACDHSRASR
jgi:hypothetical protein